MTKFDLLSIGDVTIDVFMTPTESETSCRMDTKECFVCFSYGDKIPVKRIEYSIGGNAANNSVGAARLGLKVGLVTTLGADPSGDQILRGVEKEGVGLDFVVQQPNTGSNYSTIINYSGERTIFTYHAPRSYEFPVHMTPVPWIYLTSMGETFQPFYKHIVEFMHKNPSVKLAFNPGSRQLRVGIDILRPTMEVTHVIYVNRKEAQMLTGMEDSLGKDKELLKALSTLGPKISIITDGSNGSYVYDSQKDRYYKCGILPVSAHERTGAGDSFGVGCISALVKGKSFEEALIWGTVNSASVIGYVGSQKGLLTEEELPVWLERARSSGVRVEEF
ncbi:carbohydrate kinase family protein [Patescibacteria group bacterium]|nr:carbohydrate kinase family protein [Patescibacteria group bacterium]